MDSTTKLVNLARVALAKGNYDKLKQITKIIDLDYLSGTVFDKNIKLNEDEILKIIFERKKQRKIENISEESYRAVSKRKIVPISRKDFIATFDTIERNLNLFNNKFKDKVFRIDSNDGSMDLISIGICNFYHLLGFNLVKWQENKDSIIKLFPEFKEVLECSYRDICISDNSVLYDVLYTLIEKSNVILEAIENKNESISNAFNMNKVKVKNFLFEKSDFTSYPTGIIRGNYKSGNIKGDLYLIKDHINNNNLEWGALSFRAYNENPPRNLESVLFNYFNNSEVRNNHKKVTTSIGCIDKKDYFKNPNINDIPVITKFGLYEVEYLKKILLGVNPVVDKPKTKKKQTKY